MKKIAYITGTRADYGAISSVLREINTSKDFDLYIIATGMHLMPEFGMTINEIRKDDYKIYVVNAVYEKDILSSTPKFISKFLNGLTEKLTEIKPDMILLIGDRAEMLAGAIAGQYLNIPVAHLSGGDLTGHVDDSVRHAITKLSHIHFPTNKKSEEIIIKMGEDKKRVYLVGATSLDNIKHEKLPDKDYLMKKYNLDSSRPYVIAIQHPVINEIENIEKHTKSTMDALVELKMQSVLIYPNADAGGRRIISFLKKYEKYKFLKFTLNVNYNDYLGLFKYASAIIGNSSSGIIESPSFGIPSINIGTRQIGRAKAENVIDVGYNKDEIVTALKKALNNKDFIEKCRNCHSPYGNGTAGRKIVEILSRLNISKELTKKKNNFEK